MIIDATLEKVSKVIETYELYKFLRNFQEIVYYYSFHPNN